MGRRRTACRTSQPGWCSWSTPTSRRPHCRCCWPAWPSAARSGGLCGQAGKPLAHSSVHDMAERDRRLSLEIRWSTLAKIIAAVALVSVLVRIWYILTLVLIAIIVAVGLQPAVAWLERRGFARWVAAATVVFVLFAAIVAFLAVTWTSISGQAQDLGQHIQGVEHELLRRLPEPIATVLQRSGGPNTS